MREGALHLLQLLSERSWRSAITPRTPDDGLAPGGGAGVCSLPVAGVDTIDAGSSLPQVRERCTGATTNATCSVHFLRTLSLLYPVQVLVGSLQESYHRFQLALSSRLARCVQHPAAQACAERPGDPHSRHASARPLADYTSVYHACRERPEMTELLCVEVMTRQLQASAAVQQHAVLAALAPWMDNLSFAARWEGAALSLLPNIRRDGVFGIPRVSCTKH